MCPFLTHVMLQALDGIITVVGLNIIEIGPVGEGNPLVRFLMEWVGIVPALVLVKGSAILAVLKIFLPIRKRRDLRLAVILLNIIYGASTLVWIYAIAQTQFDI